MFINVILSLKLINPFFITFLFELIHLSDFSSYFHLTSLFIQYPITHASTSQMYSSKISIFSTFFTPSSLNPILLVIYLKNYSSISPTSALIDNSIITLQHALIFIIIHSFVSQILLIYYYVNR